MTDNKKIHVCILCGGRSTEHEISLRSAANIAKAFDRSQYEVSLVIIGLDGRWRLTRNMPLHNASVGFTDAKSIVPASEGNKTILRDEGSGQPLEVIDVFFPITHGTFGEDGCIQGLLRLLNVPFVGSGVLGSAIGIDKDVSKRLLQQAGLPVAKFVTIRDFERHNWSYETLTTNLGPEIFIKPASLGSSVGVARVRNSREYTLAISKAFGLDRKIIVEEAIQCREIECAVLGNDFPESSVPGEIIVRSDFYSYETKYLSDTDSIVQIPAQISETASNTIRSLAVQAFRLLECQGMARVDFFLTPDSTIFINEINTLPGFTNISMYPKLWEYSGVNYSTLLHRIVQLALDGYQHENKLVRVYTDT